MHREYHARRSGFTLVELLIVIIIIAILAGMMMMSTGSATDRAEAMKIVSNLRSLKSATLMYYVDYKEWPNDPTGNDGWYDKSISKYMDRSLDSRYVGLWTRYGSGTNPSDLYVGIQVSGFPLSIREKLAEEARSIGLYSGSAHGSASRPYYVAAHAHVYMRMK